jgi:hypothetical protein
LRFAAGPGAAIGEVEIWWTWIMKMTRIEGRGVFTEAA